MGSARLRERAVSFVAIGAIAVKIAYSDRLGSRHDELAAAERIRSGAAVGVNVAPDGKIWDGMASARL